jgi:hypothetical protein
MQPHALLGPGRTPQHLALAVASPSAWASPDPRETHRSSCLLCWLSLAATSCSTLRTLLWYACGGQEH